MIFDLLELNEKNRKAFVGSSGVSATLKSVLRGVGWNAIVGKERFVWKPYFWEFRGEKTTVLAETLEAMKAGGLVYTFLAKAHAAHIKAATARAKKAMDSAEGADEQIDDLLDSLFPEALFLFLYGLTLSVIGAAFEPAVAALTRKL